jgi:hypothetical protein
VKQQSIRRARRGRTQFGNGLLLLCSILAGLLLAEGGYRIWLALKLHRLAQPVVDDPAPSFGVFNPPPWRFDRAVGFSYIPGLSYWTAHIEKGEFRGCTPPQVMTNEQGNIGRIFGSYDQAEIRMLVFGDSFATMHFNGDTWPNLLQRKLEQALGKSVHVVNFGRDSYGLLQMLDLAAQEVPKWRPHYVIFAFITNDLTRPRYWRVIKEVRGHWRFIMAMTPNEGIDPGIGATTNEGAIISPLVTRAWCDEISAQMAGGNGTVAREDAVVRQLVRQYNAIRIENPRSIIDPADVDLQSPRRSYLFNRIVHGDTFHDTGVRSRRVGYASIELESYAEDSAFVDAVNRVREAGAKPILIHFPVRPEIESGTPYLWRLSGASSVRQGKSLLQSLETLLGTSTVGLLEFLPRKPRDFTPYTQTPDDWHPNAKGIDLYSDAVLKALLATEIGGLAPAVRPAN